MNDFTARLTQAQIKKAIEAYALASLPNSGFRVVGVTLDLDNSENLSATVQLQVQPSTDVDYTR